MWFAAPIRRYARSVARGATEGLEQT